MNKLTTSTNTQLNIDITQQLLDSPHGAGFQRVETPVFEPEPGTRFTVKCKSSDTGMLRSEVHGTDLILRRVAEMLRSDNQVYVYRIMVVTYHGDDRVWFLSRTAKGFKK